MKGQFRLIVNEYLDLVPHKLAADGSDLLVHCSAELHHLLLPWGELEDALDIASHVHFV